MKQWSEEQQHTWYETLPMFYGSACMFLTHPSGDVLLVKPTYRDHWQIPGGTIEAHEAPHECCAREIHEELGVSLPVGQLLTLDWASAHHPRPRAMVNFLFDGGSPIDDLAEVTLAHDELEDVRFVSPSHTDEYLPANIAPRVGLALTARQARTPQYLRNGVHIG